MWRVASARRNALEAIEAGQMRTVLRAAQAAEVTCRDRALAAAQLACVSQSSQGSRRGRRGFSAAARDGPAAAAPASFVDFALTAQKDVKAVLNQHQGGWVTRLLHLSELALDLWPRQAPHWRIAAPLVVPQTSLSLSAADLRAGFAGDRGLTPAQRAACLRALCGFQSPPRTQQRTAPILAALVEGGPESLAMKLPLADALQCVEAIASSSLVPLPDSPLRDFVATSNKRAMEARKSMKFGQLLQLHASLEKCGIAKGGIQEELRRRVLLLNSAGSTGAWDAALGQDVVAIVSAARLLGEVGVLRTQALRTALLPPALSAKTAAQLLPHCLPLEGAPGPAHEFLLSVVSQQIVAQAKQLGPSDLSKALQGVLTMQACGKPFALEHSGSILRALWPRVLLHLKHFGPEDLGVALRGYSWQLQYSRQEEELSGVARDHPTVDMSVPTVAGGRGARSPARMQNSIGDFRTNLLQPVLARMQEMPLSKVAACLAALAPAVNPPHLLGDFEQGKLKEVLQGLFPPTEGAEAAQKRWADFREELWAGELEALPTADLLGFACSLKELGVGNDWVSRTLLSELTQRLRPARDGSRPSVELSHFLLLRMCRVMDLWQGHVVEDVLTNLLSSPDAVRPLPPTYFVAVLSALTKFLVPKEVPMRLVASFLDRVECGECTVTPEQWVEVLAAVRPLDEPPSWERVTPRVVQHLLPHVASLPPASLAALLETLAGEHPIAFGGERAVAMDGALAHLPGAVTGAACKAVQEGRWDFVQAVQGLDHLGALGWYSEPAVSAVLTLCCQTPLLESHAALLRPLARACARLRVHHAPLLQKIVQWYCWCDTYLRPKPLPSEQLDDLLEFAETLLELSFQSLDLQGVLAQNLQNPNASPKQILALLAALARFSNFPPEFKAACAKVCAETDGSDLSALTSKDLINAFNIHLCAVFDGPAPLKHWLTEDETMKAFFQVHTSQKWYHSQDQERALFLQSDAYLTLRSAADEEGLDLRPSDPGDVYHVELMSGDAKQRLGSADRPLALVCIKSKEQLRWYVPITATASAEGAAPEKNRCHHFRYMYKGAVQKMRHLQAMGYRTAVVWMSEWKELETQEERRAYLRTAMGAPDRESTAFSPSPVEGVDVYS